MALSSGICLAFGVGLRLWLFRTNMPQWFSSRVEIATPINSWNRVTEGLALQENHVSPYSGDIFHETPLMLRCLNYLIKTWPDYIHWLFVGVDILSALLLGRIARVFGRYLLQKQASNVTTYSADAKDLLLRVDQLKWLPLAMVAVYMFNPYSIASCLAKSTTVFQNLALILMFYSTLSGGMVLSTLFLAVATYQSLYPIMLCVPLCLHFAQKPAGTQSLTSMSAITVYVKVVLLTLTWLAALLYGSFLLEGSWDFMQSTYGFVLLVPDLAPNIGLFWYFFTEMFDHFRAFFTCVFQINVFIYTVPLAVRLRHHPVFFLFLLIALISILKSYPSYGDVSLYLSLMPLWAHLFKYMRNTLISSCMLLTCTVMSPILWHLWIYAGSANANFYFAITLTYTTAEIFLVTDLLFAFLRYDFALLHGPNPKLADGSPGEVKLQ